MSANRWRDRLPAGPMARAVRQAAGGAAEYASARAGDVRDSVKAASAAIPELVAGIGGPELPLERQWGTGFGQILVQHPNVPPRLRGVVGSLDHLGQLRISPDVIAYDGEEVDWADVREIRLGTLSDVLTSAALEHEAQRVTSLLPPVPGRGWLVRQCVDLIMALAVAATGAFRDGPSDGEQADGPAIPVVVRYRRRLRDHEMTPGVFVALVAASSPTVCEAVVSIARERGIAVTAAPPSRARQQAAGLRRMVAGMAERLARPDDQSMIEAGATGGEAGATVAEAGTADVEADTIDAEAAATGAEAPHPDTSTPLLREGEHSRWTRQ